MFEILLSYNLGEDALFFRFFDFWEVGLYSISIHEDEFTDLRREFMLNDFSFD
jgi:hypothetical protein